MYPFHMTRPWYGEDGSHIWSSHTVTGAEGAWAGDVACVAEHFVPGGPILGGYIRGQWPSHWVATKRSDREVDVHGIVTLKVEGGGTYTAHVHEYIKFWEFNPFDLTKVWPHADFPLIPVGKLTLNRNPRNYFAEVEQIAFSPAHLVPGIEPSPDKMLQGRLFSYNDTHRHRLGANWDQIPVNCPYRAGARNYQRDGPMTVSGNQEGAPNYFPNSFSGPNVNKKWTPHSEHVSGDVV